MKNLTTLLAVFVMVIFSACSSTQTCNRPPKHITIVGKSHTPVHTYKDGITTHFVKSTQGTIPIKRAVVNTHPKKIQKNQTNNLGSKKTKKIINKKCTAEILKPRIISSNKQVTAVGNTYTTATILIPQKKQLVALMFTASSGISSVVVSGTAKNQMPAGMAVVTDEKPTFLPIKNFTENEATISVNLSPLTSKSEQLKLSALVLLKENGALEIYPTPKNTETFKIETIAPERPPPVLDTFPKNTSSTLQSWTGQKWIIAGLTSLGILVTSGVLYSKRFSKIKVRRSL